MASGPLFDSRSSSLGLTRTLLPPHTLTSVLHRSMGWKKYISLISCSYKPFPCPFPCPSKTLHRLAPLWTRSPSVETKSLQRDIKLECCQVFKTGDFSTGRHNTKNFSAKHYFLLISCIFLEEFANETWNTVLRVSTSKYDVLGKDMKSSPPPESAFFSVIAKVAKRFPSFFESASFLSR